MSQKTEPKNDIPDSDAAARTDREVPASAGRKFSFFLFSCCCAFFLSSAAASTFIVSISFLLAHFLFILIFTGHYFILLVFLFNRISYLNFLVCFFLFYCFNFCFLYLLSSKQSGKKKDVLDEDKKTFSSWLSSQGATVLRLCPFCGSVSALV